MCSDRDNLRSPEEIRAAADRTASGTGCGRTGDRLHIREHLANERTFLAWIRTAVTILAFGFVIEKFSVYLRLLEWQAGMVDAPAPGTAAYLGGGFSAVAGLVVIMAAVRYRQTRRQIEEGRYRPSLTADMLLAGILFMVTVLVVVYLLRAILR